jgi:hypothetical protein
MTEVFEIRSAPPAGSPLSPRAGAIWDRAAGQPLPGQLAAFLGGGGLEWI